MIKWIILETSRNLLHNQEMDLDTIPVFIKVVQSGSFSQAARELGIPNTTVSAQIARLERSLGMTLIQRTTRQLIITQAGQTFYEGCVRAMGELQATQSELESATKEPTGTLRISVASDVAHSILPPIIKTYLEKYPKAQVDVVVTNRMVDMVKEGIDVVICAGELNDSGLVAKKLIEIAGGFWATEAYLRKAGALKHPRDLKDHQCLVLTPLSRKEMKLNNGSEEVKVMPPSRLVADELEALREFALLHIGIAFLPDFMAEDRQSNPKLIRVLPKWRWTETKLSLVYPSQKYVPPRLRAFIEIASQ